MGQSRNPGEQKMIRSHHYLLGCPVQTGAGISSWQFGTLSDKVTKGSTQHVVQIDYNQASPSCRCDQCLADSLLIWSRLYQSNRSPWSPKQILVTWPGINLSLLVPGLLYTNQSCVITLLTEKMDLRTCNNHYSCDNVTSMGPSTLAPQHLAGSQSHTHIPIH